MSEQEQKNEEVLAKIESVIFGREDHGIMTLSITFDYGQGGCQSFGGYCLDTFDKEKDRRIGSAAGMDYVMQIMNVMDVTNLQDMVGKMCYAIKDGPRFFGKVIGIKQIPQDGDSQFLIKDWQQEWFPGEEDKF